MRAIITTGDALSHGGSVIGGTPFTDIGGRPVARVGDRVVCAVHGLNSIVSGDSTLVIDGSPVARHGDKTACGASLISHQQTTYVEAGRAAGSSVGAGNGSPTVVPTALAPLDSDKTAVCEECLLAGARRAAVFLGR